MVAQYTNKVVQFNIQKRSYNIQIRQYSMQIRSCNMQIIKYNMQIRLYTIQIRSYNIQIGHTINVCVCLSQIKPSETVDLTQLTNTMSGLWTAVTAVCLLENALDIDAEVGEVCNATGPVATRLDTFTRGLERNVVRRMDHNYQSPGPLVVPDNVHGTYLIRCVQEMLRNTWQVLSNLNSQQSPSSHGN